MTGPMTTLPDLEPAALEALARAYDKEDAAQRGEPDPWRAGADGPWYEERIACAHVAAAAYLSAAPSTVPEAGKAVEEEPVGWAYQDKRWDKGRWHVCGLDSKPRAHEGREIRAIYIASNGTALASSPAPTGAEPTGEIAGLIARLKRHYPGEEPMPLMTEAAAVLTGLSARLATAETARYVAATNYLDLVKYKERLEAEATSLRRKLEEHRKALEPFYVVAKTLPDPRLINDEAPGVMARHAPGFKAALGKLVLGDFRRVFWLMEKP